MSGCIRFKVRALPSAQTLPRLINHFAQRDLIPSIITSMIADERLHVLIELADIGVQEGSIIAEKMRSAVLVESVEFALCAE